MERKIDFLAKDVTRGYKPFLYSYLYSQEVCGVALSEVRNRTTKPIHRGQCADYGGGEGDGRGKRGYSEINGNGEKIKMKTKQNSYGSSMHGNTM